jgi:hypothetical protein
MAGSETRIPLETAQHRAGRVVRSAGIALGQLAELDHVLRHARNVAQGRPSDHFMADMCTLAIPMREKPLRHFYDKYITSRQQQAQAMSLAPAPPCGLFETFDQQVGEIQ